MALKSWRRLTIGLALLAGLTAGPAASAEGRRIAALGGVVTEILYALGAGSEVVAVDTTSLQPPEALATKLNVGYLRQLSAEGILSARPTLVLAVDGAGPPDVMKLVREAGVPVTSVPEDPTEAGVESRIQSVARAIGRDEAGRALVESVRTRFATLAAIRRKAKPPIRALFILSLQNGRMMVGGRNTTADGMLALAGAENAASGVDGYKPMTDEAVVAARPDVVVMMTSGPGGAPPADLFAGPALSQTPAARGGRLVVMDGLYLLGFGPRTPDAARDLMTAFYPALSRE